MHTLLATVLLSTVVAAAGCVVEDDLPTRSSTFDLTNDNGVSVNGVSVNGVSVNGVSVNGVSVNGVSVNGVSVNGVSVNGVSVNGVSVNGVSVNGNALSAPTAEGGAMTGTDFVGATFTSTMTNGGSLTLRIDSAATLTGANDDVWTYGVSFQDDAGTWHRLCGDNADGSAKLAIPVEGTWNLAQGVAGGGSWSPGDFSFACRGASVAKCVEFGYKPWDGLGDEHHACVRMLRADYCGDGTPHTVNGTLINLYDDLGIQADTESWPVDATWTPDGAGCLNHYRGGAEPACYAAKYSATCGGFSGGNELVSEYNG
jgi:hypothetical protein